MSQYHPNPRRSMAPHQLHPAPRPNSSSADEPALVDASGLGPVYFFKNPETEYCSQWYSLEFGAPLPTRGSIMAGPAKGEAGRMHTFDCNEQYMMYAKAVLFNDQNTAQEVLQTTGNPRKCKGLGRKVAHFDGKVWDQHKEEVVEEGNWWKFTNGEGNDGLRIRNKLLATGDRDIIEASPYDRIWGIGFSADQAEANRARWGQNLLGKALVRVRQRIRERDANTKREEEQQAAQEEQAIQEQAQASHQPHEGSKVVDGEEQQAPPPASAIGLAQ